MSLEGLITREAALGTLPTAQEELGRFLASCEAQNTRLAFGRHLRAALNHLGITRLDELTTRALEDYRTHLLADGRGPASHNQALAALRSFLGWAAAHRGLHLPEHALRRFLRMERATVTRPYQVLSEAELSRLLLAANGPRDRAMVLIFVGGGLRVSEVATLDLADLHLDGTGETLLHVRASKGQKDRLVPIRDEVVEGLHRYLAATGRTVRDQGPLFLAEDRALRSRKAIRMGVRAMQLRVRDLCRTAGVAKTISPHALRHTYAIRYLRSGGTLSALAKLLGHASVTTTQRYVDHLALGEIRATLPPLPVGA